MLKLWRWLRPGLTPENVVQGIIGGAVGIGVPFVVGKFVSVSLGSLVVIGIGSAMFAFGLLFVVRKRTDGNKSAPASEPLTAPRRTWEISHSPYAAPPHRSVSLHARNGGRLPEVRRIVCEVTTPSWRQEIYRFWDPEVAPYHLGFKNDVSCTYPDWFVEYEGESYPNTPLEDGYYFVQWWAVADDGASRWSLGEDTFRAVDGALYLGGE